MPTALYTGQHAPASPAPTPTARPSAQSVAPKAVKIERHDLSRRLHHTTHAPRPVDIYQRHRHGLFVARPFTGHPQVRYWQAHLLPAALLPTPLPGGLGLQVCRYDFHGERQHDHYLDLGQISVQDDIWTLRDLYLDVALHSGRGAELLDADELLAAGEAGYLSAAELLAAIQTGHAVLEGLAEHGHRLDPWLASLGLTLHWLQEADAAHADGPTGQHADGRDVRR
jgi:uncharacterized protein